MSRSLLRIQVAFKGLAGFLCRHVTLKPVGGGVCLWRCERLRSYPGGCAALTNEAPTTAGICWRSDTTLLQRFIYLHRIHPPPHLLLP